MIIFFIHAVKKEEQTNKQTNKRLPPSLEQTKPSSDHGSGSSHVMPKTQKIVLIASFLNTWHYKDWIMG